MLYLLIVLLSFLLSLIGPWWTLAPVCFATCWWRAKQGRQAFWVSVFAGLTVWLGYAIYLHFVSEVDLTTQIAGVFTAGIPALSAIPGIVVALVVMALLVIPISGLAGVAGVKARQFIRRPR